MLKATFAAAVLLCGALPALGFDLQRDWLVSDWPAGQSSLMRWSPEMVQPGEEGLDFVLGANPEAGPVKARAGGEPDDGGEVRPFLGGEIQSRATFDEGVWSWRARAPRMVEGAVFGLFLYRADHEADPWREYDIEFVGGGTRALELNIHFEDAEGRHVSLKDGPKRVELGFDAAAGFHDYEIEVRPRRAVFRVDGEVVGEFGPEDIEGGIWSDGPLRSFVDLWAVAPAQAEWAGVWAFDGVPLTATLEEAQLPSSAQAVRPVSRSSAGAAGLVAP